MTTKLTAKDLYEGAHNLETLRTIAVRHQQAKIQVGGKSVAIDAVTANALVTVLDALSLENEMKFVSMLAHSQDTFQRVLDFSWAHVS